MARKKNAQLPDWFPLPTYSEPLTRNQWLEEVALRAGLQTAEKNWRGGKTDGLHMDKKPEKVFRNLFVTKRSRRTKGNLAEAQKQHWWPVRDPTPFEVYFLAESQRIPEHKAAEAWATRLNQEGRPAVAEFTISGGHEKMARIGRSLAGREVRRSTYADIMGKQIPLLVDLDHDDKTLKFAFDIWLAAARDELKEKAHQPIGDKDFEKWKRFGLLPAFDLMFWSRITQSIYTEAFMATAIWPDNADSSEFVDTTERFRKVTRPMVEQVFEWNFVQRFWSQMELENTLDVVVARDKAKKRAPPKGKADIADHGGPIA